MSSGTPAKAEAANLTTGKDSVADTEKPKSSLELLEEDDEFEEFQGSWDDAKASNEVEDSALWRDNWDDDDGQDDFMEQLRTHISTTGK